MHPWCVLAALSILVHLVVAGSVTAQGDTVKRTVIRPGRVLDVRTGERRTNQAIVIEGDKIAQMAPPEKCASAQGIPLSICPTPPYCPA